MTRGVDLKQLSAEAAEPFVLRHPDTGEELAGMDWAMPGLWNLARMRGRTSGREYWVELPFGLGALLPVFLEISNRTLDARSQSNWSGQSLARAFSEPRTEEVALRVERVRETRRVCLFNCYHSYFGDALSLLMRINSAPENLGESVAVLIPENLAWLRHPRIAEYWIVPGALRLAGGWSAGLAAAVKREVARLDGCVIPHSFQPASVSSEELREWTGVETFERANWVKTIEKPTVTFYWRSDRYWARGWSHEGAGAGRLDRVRAVRDWKKRRGLREQKRKVVGLAETLRGWFAGLKFILVGDRDGELFPEWFTDLRAERPSAEVERHWLAAYGESNIAIGVHGSHMLFPSGFAGATIELMPQTRQRNYLQDVLVTCEAGRMAAFLYRFLPVSCSARELAEICASLIYRYPQMAAAYEPEFYGSPERGTLARIQATLRELPAAAGERLRLPENIY